MSDSYVGFASVYDKLMDAVPYAEWNKRIVDAIDRYGISKRVRSPKALPEGDLDSALSGSGEDYKNDCPEEEYTEEMDGFEAGHVPTREECHESERNLVVDLGCGTGTITELLYNEGFDMIGIDNSEEMLEIAFEKRDESGSDILYLNQDMLELELYSTVGTVVSVCDSLNYLTGEDDLETVSGLVHNYLYPGGLFIFDLNTVYKYREVIGESTIAESREDCSFIWDNYYDSESGINEYDLTLFVRGEDGRYDRFEETHFQRGFEAEEVEKLLRKTGFEVVKLVDSESGEKPDGATERIFVIAKCIKNDVIQGSGD